MTVERFKGASGAEWMYDSAHQLGQSGGFGAVYEGEGAQGNPVAIKVVALGPFDTVPAELRLREVAIGRKVEPGPGDHLVRVLDVATANGRLFIVMERAAGALSDLIGPGMDEVAALKVLRDVTAGLMELHALGVLHRDLKPRNVLDLAGTWKLADFGISRDLDQSTGTLTWAGAGTLPYMAPELFEPPGRATVKTDLYALGCLAFEVFTGSPPFTAVDEAALIKQHREVAAASLLQINPALRRLVARLLNKDPAERPQDARAVAEALARVVIADPPPEAAGLLHHAERHDRERAVEAAERSADADRRRRDDERRKQAVAELHAIVEDGHALVEQVLPDVRLEARPPTRFVLEGDDATVQLIIWDAENPHRDPDSPRVLAGDVEGHNRLLLDEPPLANIVCEIEDGRLTWFLYRFRKSALVGPNYQLGPHDRRHGFLKQQFYGDDVLPFLGTWSGTHIFQKERTALDAGQVRDLYAAAMALPDDG